MSIHSKEIKKVTTHVLQEMKDKGEKISMLTAYDYTMARLLDRAGVDVLLVGDSASNVMAGHETTLPITLDQMITMHRRWSGPCKGPWWWWIYPLVPTKEIPKKPFRARSAS